jgi:serine/threonine protein kinase
MIEAGTLLQNRYRIKKQIGQGGMGAVYVATDERFGSTVAIKETFFSDANYSKAFEREARLLNNLRHPALPRVSDHFSDDHGQFLVMEYITGDDLSEMMEKQDGAFPLKDVLNWADQLLDALDYLHTQEMPVVHRDIKPQNLKLTPRGQIILLDFGLAKGNPTDAQHNTAAKSVFGYSRNYASIEQMQGTGTDPRSDLYSLGATLYHLATGMPPVDALTRAMQVLNGDRDPLQPANLAHNQVPAAIADVLQRAMALNSNHRPSSALAMRTMLAESANAVPENAGAAVPSYSTSLLTQNTEVFDNAPQARNTQQAAVKTELLPVENSANFAVQTNALHDQPLEDETSVKTRKETAKPNNIQIPVRPKTATRTQPLYQTRSNGSKGKLIGATLGGLLLVGGALGGFYIWKPAAPNVANTNVVIENKQPMAGELSGDSSNVNIANSNILANTPTNLNPVETANTRKETTDRTASDISTPKTVSPPKDVTPETPKPEAPPETKVETKVIVADKEGNQVFEDGTVKSKDGTIVYPDGRVVKDGRVLHPGSNVQVRPIPAPNIKIPILTREQMERLTPEQRRKIRDIMERQRRQMEMQRRRMENRPPPTPPNQ